jgi:hypothetical protein
VVEVTNPRPAVDVAAIRQIRLLGQQPAERGRLVIVEFEHVAQAV